MLRTVTVGFRAAIAAAFGAPFLTLPQPLERISLIGPAPWYCFQRFFSPPSVKCVCVPETLAVAKRAPWR